VLDAPVLEELLVAEPGPEGVGRLEPAAFLALRAFAAAPPDDALEAEERLLALIRLSVGGMPPRSRCTAGFASHSHLTDSFRRSFGVAPSRLRPH
jgi:methylphosphotriester-DNA--protein-cysteine methyltransferase